MDERDGLVGLWWGALLAWLLPAAVVSLAPESRPWPTILARAGESSPGDAPRLSWDSSATAPDGWSLSAFDIPLGPVPGWRGLLLGHPLDLNSATAADLEALPGIGPRTAAAVLTHRATKGPFSAVDELAGVRGIGPATLRRLGPSLRVAGPPGPR